MWHLAGRLGGYDEDMGEKIFFDFAESWQDKQFQNKLQQQLPTLINPNILEPIFSLYNLISHNSTSQKISIKLIAPTSGVAFFKKCFTNLFIFSFGLKLPKMKFLICLLK